MVMYASVADGIAAGQAALNPKVPDTPEQIARRQLLQQRYQNSQQGIYHTSTKVKSPVDQFQAWNGYYNNLAAANGINIPQQQQQQSIAPQQQQQTSPMSSVEDQRKQAWAQYAQQQQQQPTMSGVPTSNGNLTPPSSGLDSSYGLPSSASSQPRGILSSTGGAQYNSGGFLNNRWKTPSWGY